MWLATWPAPAKEIRPAPANCVHGAGRTIAAIISAAHTTRLATLTICRPVALRSLVGARPGPTDQTRHLPPRPFVGRGPNTPADCNISSKISTPNVAIRSASAKKRYRVPAKRQARLLSAQHRRRTRPPREAAHAEKPYGHWPQPIHGSPGFAHDPTPPLPLSEIPPPAAAPPP